MEHKCQEIVWSNFEHHDCGRKTLFEFEGKHYCKMHIKSYYNKMSAKQLKDMGIMERRFFEIEIKFYNDLEVNEQEFTAKENKNTYLIISGSSYDYKNTFNKDMINVCCSTSTYSTTSHCIKGFIEDRESIRYKIFNFIQDRITEEQNRINGYKKELEKLRKKK